MSGRFINSEIIHRKGIYREAINLLRNGWHVMANHIPGFCTPPEIEGFIPDIYAVKDDQTYIIDLLIEGSPTCNSYTVHAAYARHDTATQYNCWLLDSAGCRMDEYLLFE